MPDPLGNVNNWLFVRRADGGAGGGGGGDAGGVGVARAPAAAACAAALPPPPAAVAVADVDMDAPDAPAPSPPGGLPPGLAAVPPAPALPPGAASAPPCPQPEGEPARTRAALADFLRSRTAADLVPDSGKLVILDARLPVRLAFVALHDERVATAPVWCPKARAVVGMLSPSDFVAALVALRSSVTAGASPMSESEMDAHTVGALRAGGVSGGGGTPPGAPPPRSRPLVAVAPDDTLADVVRTLAGGGVSVAPVMAAPGECGPGSARTPVALASLAGVLGAALRALRAPASALPLLSASVGDLPLGTWAPDAPPPPRALPPGAVERVDARRVRVIASVSPSTPLATALGTLLQAGLSALPVVGPDGALIDVYARADITALARGGAYSRLQWEDVTVGQALALAALPTAAWAPATAGAPPPPSAPFPPRPPRVFVCTPADTLRAVVERLASPGVRRVYVIDGPARRVLAVVSLSDVAAFLFGGVPAPSGEAREGVGVGGGGGGVI